MIVFLVIKLSTAALHMNTKVDTLQGRSTSTRLSRSSSIFSRLVLVCMQNTPFLPEHKADILMNKAVRANLFSFSTVSSVLNGAPAWHWRYAKRTAHFPMTIQNAIFPTCTFFRVAMLNFSGRVQRCVSQGLMLAWMILATCASAPPSYLVSDASFRAIAALLMGMVR